MYRLTLNERDVRNLKLNGRILGGNNSADGAVVDDVSAEVRAVWAVRLKLCT